MQEQDIEPKSTSESPVTEPENLESQLAAAQNEIEELKDKYLRAMAEMENTRRRTEREKADLLQFGLERFMVDLLPVMDSVDKALSESAANPESLLKGFELTKKQLENALGKHGLAVVESEGAKFDPNLHQAIQRIESAEVDEDKVKQVFVKGYTLNGRLIRPAMVSVEVPH